MIKLFIVDEVFMVCQVIAAALEDEPDIEVIGYTTSLTEAISLAKDSNLVLASATLPNNGAFRLTQLLSQTNALVKVIITGMPDSSTAILSYIDAGGPSDMFYERNR